MKRIYNFLLVVTMVCAANAQVKGDFDGDNKVTIQDITELINIYLNQSGENAGYQAIDLGLSVKWANMNVGATAPEEAGNYYAWAWPHVLESYSVYTCPWLDDWGRQNRTRAYFHKYCTSETYGTVDGKSQIELEDDAAYVNMDTTWRMPTLEEARELLDSCTWEWITQNEVPGYQVTGPNGRSIFLPAAGAIDSRFNAQEATNVGKQGRYWTSTLSSEASSWANAIFFNKPYNYLDISETQFRENGFTVRGVLRNDIEEKSVWGDIDCDGSVTVADIVMLIDIYLNTEIDDGSYKAIDLGLSVKWANMNVGASSPEEFGNYYAWGSPNVSEHSGIKYTPWLRSDACIGGDHYVYKFSKYCTRNDMGTVDNKTVLEPEDDAAYVNMGTDWRTPSAEEAQELIDKCTWEWTTLNDVGGFQVTGPSGQSIFIPATGARAAGIGTYGVGTFTILWLNSINPETVSPAYILYIVHSSGEAKPEVNNTMLRDSGCRVRGVKP